VKFHTIKQNGFTFIEMMIVVAVIGVMSVIVLPAYTEYTTRAKVADAVNLLAGLKYPMTDFYITWGVWPTVEEIGGKSTGVYTSVVTSGKPDTYVEAVMKGTDASPLGGKRLRMVYNPITRDWVCTTQGTSSPIPDNLLPSSCK
jgi:type IV pilus assembly protein PilA